MIKLTWHEPMQINFCPSHFSFCTVFVLIFGFFFWCARTKPSDTLQSTFLNSDSIRIIQTIYAANGSEFGVSAFNISDQLQKMNFTPYGSSYHRLLRNSSSSATVVPFLTTSSHLHTTRVMLGEDLSAHRYLCRLCPSGIVCGISNRNGLIISGTCVESCTSDYCNPIKQQEILIPQVCQICGPKLCIKAAVVPELYFQPQYKTAGERPVLSSNPTPDYLKFPTCYTESECCGGRSKSRCIKFLGSKGLVRSSSSGQFEGYRRCCRSYGVACGDNSDCCSNMCYLSSETGYNTCHSKKPDLVIKNPFLHVRSNRTSNSSPAPNKWPIGSGSAPTSLTGVVLANTTTSSFIKPSTEVSPTPEYAQPTIEIPLPRSIEIPGDTVTAWRTTPPTISPLKVPSDIVLEELLQVPSLPNAVSTQVPQRIKTEDESAKTENESAKTEDKSAKTEDESGLLERVGQHHSTLSNSIEQLSDLFNIIGDLSGRVKKSSVNYLE